jgi:hypothetical protein
MTEAPMPENGLKPCPFCGGEARSWPSSSCRVIVGCEESSERCPVNPHVHGREAQAITAWNTRTPAGEGGAKDAVERAAEVIAKAADEYWSLPFNDPRSPYTFCAQALSDAGLLAKDTPNDQ